MSNQEQLPPDSPSGTTLDELDHRHITDTKTPKGLLYGGIAALALAVIIALLITNHVENKRAAAQALGSANTEEELSAVADEHKDTVSAGTALVELSNRQIAQERYEEAVTTLDSFFADYEDHPLADRALLAKASALVRLERAEDALAALDQFDASHDDSPYTDIATLLRGDIEQKRGNIEAARAAYQVVASSDSDERNIPQIASSRERFINYSSPREVEPAPEPELPDDTELPPASTGDPELDALINNIGQNTEEGTTVDPTPQETTTEEAESPADEVSEEEPAESDSSEETTE